ncbi:hypothetical protein CDAR_33161 [Caerostris darwini]|uniref:Uncharacterized protein n=1 Tax=Caerostris darwini TaxID=1538125 RepID=A0AAV4X1S6_9ARAC|nr:hypothetical protein CDAR_33161 [Caerostris darwini]
MCSSSSDGVEETSGIHSEKRRLQVFSEEEERPKKREALTLNKRSKASQTVWDLRTLPSTHQKLNKIMSSGSGIDFTIPNVFFVMRKALPGVDGGREGGRNKRIYRPSQIDGFLKSFRRRQTNREKKRSHLNLKAAKTKREF